MSLSDRAISWRYGKLSRSCVPSLSYDLILTREHFKQLGTARGAARIFLRGGWNYGSKSYEKERLLVIRIARKAHILWINSWLYSPRNLGSFQLNCHFVSLIFFHDDRKNQPPWLLVSAEFCFDLWFFSTVGKHISHVHVFFIFAKFKKRIKLLCAKLVVLTCLMRL